MDSVAASEAVDPGSTPGSRTTDSQHVRGGLLQKLGSGSSLGVGVDASSASVEFLKSRIDETKRNFEDSNLATFHATLATFRHVPL